MSISSHSNPSQKHVSLLQFGKTKAKEDKKEKTTSQDEDSKTIETPKHFKFSFEPGKKGNKTHVTVSKDEVAFSSPLKPTYKLWQPGPDFQPKPAMGVWTRRYIGTDKAFYEQGYRWGVSLGNTPESFKASGLVRPDGGINLPDGKYMIVFRGDANGVKEIVIGKEDRGIDKRFLKALGEGNPPKTPDDKQILGVANHSMLASRGQVMNGKNKGDFSVIFAGEITVEDNFINTLNDQSGQFFGPNGVMKPISGDATPDDADKVMKQPEYDAMKTNALVAAKTALEKVTGHQNIHMIKVVFVRDAEPVEVLQQPIETKIKTEHLQKLEQWLAEPEIQALFDLLDARPELQERLIKGLALNGSSRRPILKLVQELVAKETVKPEQGAKLAVELFTEPNGIGLFVPGSPYHIQELSDNTKRKLLEAFNGSEIKTENSLGDLVSNLKHKHPVVIQFMVGRRIAGGYIKRVLTDLKDAAEAVRHTIRLFSPSSSACTTSTDAGAPIRIGNDPVLINRLDRGKRALKDVARLHEKKPDKPIDVVLMANPFDLPDFESGNDLAKGIQLLRKLQKDGVDVFRSDGASEKQPMEYLNNLFAHVHPAQTPQEVIQKNKIKALLKQYDIVPEAIRDFAMSKFEGRWANDLIVASYAQEDKGFRTLLEDLVWYRSLPKINPFQSQ
jgi:hypothetical protein